MADSTGICLVNNNNGREIIHVFVFLPQEVYIHVSRFECCVMLQSCLREFSKLKIKGQGLHFEFPGICGFV